VIERPRSPSSQTPDFYSSIDEIERLRATLDVLNAGVSHVSPEGKILWVNRFYCDFYGYTLEELQQLTIADTSHPDDVAPQRELMRKVASGELEGFQLDRRCKRKDGTFAWANINTRMLKGADGKPLFYVTYLLDIREQKEAELKLRESQSRLEQAMNLAQMGSWERKIESNEIKWSRECYAIFDRSSMEKPYSLEEVTAMIHPDDIETFKSGIERRNASSTGETLVYRIIRPTDGAVKTLRTVARHVPDPEGGPGRLVGVLQDITEWVEQRTARKHSEELLQLVLNAVPARIGYVNRDLRYRFVNRGYEIQLGMSKEKIVGKSVKEIQGDKIFKEFTPYYEQVFSGKMVEFDKEVVGPDGVRRDLHVVFSPDFGPERQVLGFVTMIQDLTQEREKEKMILEQRQRMISSAKLAALGEMAGGISHEINNPLAIIHARAESLKEMALKGNVDVAKLAYSAEKIELTSKRIAKIVKALRNIARDGEKDPFSRVSVKTIVEDAVEISKERFQHYAIDFQILDISADLAIECRAVQISQVVLNLLSNAFDAARSVRERWVRLEARQVDERIEISVTDSGPGVPIVIRDKIFQPFFTTKEPGEGTGLGLSVSKAIMDDHHGTIVLDDQSSHTRFIVSLPIKQPR
jgi:PAS domain S-box-containing protein